MKNCGRCKIDKDLSEFTKDKNTFDRLCWMCRACKSLTMKTLRVDSEEFRKKAKIRNKESILNLSKWVFEFLLEHPCVDCGLKDPRCLEFDHVLGSKDSIISELKSKGSKQKLFSEIEKCVVRCGNCHRKKSGTDYPSYKDKAYEGL